MISINTFISPFIPAWRLVNIVAVFGKPNLTILFLFATVYTYVCSIYYIHNNIFPQKNPALQSKNEDIRKLHVVRARKSEGLKGYQNCLGYLYNALLDFSRVLTKCSYGIASQPKHRQVDKKKNATVPTLNESVIIASVNSFSKSINILRIIADNNDGDNCPAKSQGSTDGFKEIPSFL